MTTASSGWSIVRAGCSDIGHLLSLRREPTRPTFRGTQRPRPCVLDGQSRTFDGAERLAVSAGTLLSTFTGTKR